MKTYTIETKDSYEQDMEPVSIILQVSRRIDLVALEALLNQVVEEEVCEAVQRAASGTDFLCYRLWDLVKNLCERRG